MPKIREPLLPYQDENTIEIGIDEVARGCLACSLAVGVVILDPCLIDTDDPNYKLIRDSKTLSEKQRKVARKYIEEEIAAYYHVEFASAKEIDEHNILQANFNAMHRALDKVCSEYMEPEKILVDGDRFRRYKEIPYECVTKGDNIYASIASASILAKTYRDEYIERLCDDDPSLDEKYGWRSNKCYGTRQHMKGLEKYGVTNHHRMSFEPCAKHLLLHEA